MPDAPDLARLLLGLDFVLALVVPLLLYRLLDSVKARLEGAIAGKRRTAYCRIVRWAIVALPALGLEGPDNSPVLSDIKRWFDAGLRCPGSPAASGKAVAGDTEA